MSKATEVLARLEADDTVLVGPDGGRSDDSEGTRTEPATVETTETTSAGGSEPAATTATPLAAAAVANATPPATAKTPEEERKEQRTASQFAALSRQKQENLRIIQEAETRQREIATLEERIAAREKEIARVLETPESVFELLEKKLGIKSAEDLQKFAAKQWSAPRAAEPTGAKALTAEEVQRMLDDREHVRRIETVRSQVETDFVKLTDDDTKYEAAALLYTPAQRVSEGNRIANELTKLGEKWTLEDIADAVDELARQDPRYAKLQARGSAKGLASSTASPAGQQALPAKTPRIPTSDDAGERATTHNGANGASRLSHRDRVAMLKEQARTGR